MYMYTCVYLLINFGYPGFIFLRASQTQDKNSFWHGGQPHAKHLKGARIWIKEYNRLFWATCSYFRMYMGNSILTNELVGQIAIISKFPSRYVALCTP